MAGCVHGMPSGMCSLCSGIAADPEPFRGRRPDDDTPKRVSLRGKTEWRGVGETFESHGSDNAREASKHSLRSEPRERSSWRQQQDWRDITDHSDLIKKALGIASLFKSPEVAKIALQAAETPQGASKMLVRAVERDDDGNVVVRKTDYDTRDKPPKRGKVSEVQVCGRARTTRIWRPTDAHVGKVRVSVYPEMKRREHDDE